MTTTAHEDQFTAGTQTIQPVLQPYSTEAILRRNIADAKKEMQRQAERAESYADAMRSLASYVGAGGYNADVVDADVFEAKIRWGIDEIMARTEKAEAELAKARKQDPVAWMRPDDEGYDSHFRDHSTVVSCPTNPWTGYIPLYAAPVPAPDVPAQVPEEWIKVMAELTDDLQAACDAEHPHRDKYPSVMRRYNNDMEIVEKARALLQSAEVTNADADRLIQEMLK